MLIYLSGMRDCGLTKSSPTSLQLSKAVSSLSTDKERIYRECRRVVHEGVTGPEEEHQHGLTIEPERASSDKSAVSLSAFMNEQLDF